MTLNEGIKEKTFNDYMPGGGKYVNPTDVNNNYCIEYISSTYLNGYINYVKLKSGYILDKYQDIDKLPTKELMSAFSNAPFNQLFHTKFYDWFKNDTILLGRGDKSSVEGAGDWFYFWYDCDVSDCCFGRFETDDVEEVVLELFDKHIKKLSSYNNDCETFKFDVSKLCGWISW